MKFYTPSEKDFSYREWSSKILSTPEEIMDALRSFHIAGRKIKEMKLVGHCYNRKWNDIWEEAYDTLFKDYEPESRDWCSEIMNMPDDAELSSFIETDDPLLIKFEDGDVFEIGVRYKLVVHMGMNSIPWDINPSCNPRNVDINRIYEICVGRTITSFGINDYPSRDDGYDDMFEESITIWLDGDIGINLAECDDYFDIELIKRDGTDIDIPAKTIRAGLFNWEDLHYDSSISFDTYCETLWFGDKVSEYIGGTNIIDFVATRSDSFLKENDDHIMHMIDEDFAMFSLGISCATGVLHDIYQDYQFEYNEWLNVMEQLQILSSFTSYNVLQDYCESRMRDQEAKDSMVYYLKNLGGGLWADIDLHRKEVKTMKSWTETVLLSGMTMKIIGV